MALEEGLKRKTEAHCPTHTGSRGGVQLQMPTSPGACSPPALPPRVHQLGSSRRYQCCDPCIAPCPAFHADPTPVPLSPQAQRCRRRDVLCQAAGVHAPLPTPASCGVAAKHTTVRELSSCTVRHAASAASQKLAGTARGGKATHLAHPTLGPRIPRHANPPPTCRHVQRQ